MSLGKVIEQSKIEELVNHIKKQNKTIVATNGCFDILHVGHVRYLKKSKSFGDVLIVGLNSDVSVKSIKGPDRPINNEDDRAEILCSLNSVDYVVLFDEKSLNTLPEADVILKNNGWIEFIDFVEGKSTTKIIDKIK